MLQLQNDLKMIRQYDIRFTTRLQVHNTHWLLPSVSKPWSIPTVSAFSLPLLEVTTVVAALAHSLGVGAFLGSGLCRSFRIIVFESIIATLFKRLCWSCAIVVGAFEPMGVMEDALSKTNRKVGAYLSFGFAGA